MCCMSEAAAAVPPYCSMQSTPFRSDSRRTSTSVLLPDSSTARSSSRLSRSHTTLSAASVLPDPGTPVIKQIDFVLFLFDSSIILATAPAVTLRFFASSSERVMPSSPEMLLHSAVAASVIVGVGLYLERSQSEAATLQPGASSLTCLMTQVMPSLFARARSYTPSLHRSIPAGSAAPAFVDTSIGTIDAQWLAS